MAITHLIERELLALDYAITLLMAEDEFDGSQLRYCILSLQEADSTGRYRDAYHSYMQLFKTALPEKYRKILI